jgi:dienelactone hydrolase
MGARRAPGGLVLSLAIPVLALLVACGNALPGQSTAIAATGTVSPTVSSTGSAKPSVIAPANPGEPVSFATDDGVAIEGRVFGSGDVGVVLAHGTFEIGQASWFPFARTLAEKGYLVLTLNLRGFCPGGINGCSGGSRNPPETWRDVAAAADFLAARGTARVFLMGASLGARACLWAASRPGVNVAGVIGASTPLKAVAAYSPGYDFTAEVIAAIEEPKLFMAGDRDEDYATQARTMFGWAAEPRYLTIVSSSAHGPVLMGATGATEAVLDFLARYR